MIASMDTIRRETPEWTDPHADEGRHEFTYSLYPPPWEATIGHSGAGGTLTRKHLATKMTRRGNCVQNTPENRNGTGTQRRGTSTRTSASRQFGRPPAHRG